MKKTKKVVSFLWVVMLVLNIFQGSNGYIEAVSNPQAEPPFAERLRIDVEKRWREMPENGEEAFAEIALFRNDEEVNRVRMTGPSWYHTFVTDSTGADLPIRNADGLEYKYTVKEVDCTAGYGVVSETDIFDGPYEMPSPNYKKFTVYNSKLVNENLRILVKKYWIQGEMWATALPEDSVNTDGAVLAGEMQIGKPKPIPKPNPKPKPEKPEKPEPKEPEKPEPKEPEKPEPKEPEKPEPKEPEKPEPKEPEKPEPKEPEKPEPKEPNKPEPKEPNKPDNPKPQEPNNPKNPEPLTPYVPTPPTTPETEVPLEDPKVPEGEPSKPEVPVTPDKPNTPEAPIPIEEPEPEPIPQGSPELPKTSGIPLEILAGAGLGLLALGALLKKKKS